jgi:hypothetical protein
MKHKTFTVQEARALLPKVRGMLKDANQQLEAFVDRLEKAKSEHVRIEARLNDLKTDDKSPRDLGELRECRNEFQESIQRLADIEQEYMHCMTMWVDDITDLGIILRDLSSGLLDFPAQKGDTEYLLCWRLADKDIEYWHLPTDGFRGRRPLAVLDEYF